MVVLSMGLTMGCGLLVLTGMVVIKSGTETLGFFNIEPWTYNSSESNLFRKKIFCLMVACSSPLTKLSKELSFLYTFPGSAATAGFTLLEVGELLKLRETLTRVYVQRTGKPLW
ncbi:hypothetical protein Ccrd_026132, partial [Cynara cardunculus var. scolymus]